MQKIKLNENNFNKNQQGEKGKQQITTSLSNNVQKDKIDKELKAQILEKKDSKQVKDAIFTHMEDMAKVNMNDNQGKKDED